MTAQFRIYQNILIRALENLSSLELQKYTWFPNDEGKMSSFVEDVNNIFDDALVADALENNQVIYDRKVTEALVALSDAVDAVDEFRGPEDIIDDPLMQIVREKAAKALALIKASTGKGSTVEIA